MRPGARKRKLLERFGKVPEWHYFSGDMKGIRAYYDYCRDTGRTGFSLDDITWNDLDMDDLFVRINPRRCTPGEQYLYYMLRTPALRREEWESRRDLIEAVSADPERRLKAEMVLDRLGCTRQADLRALFAPPPHSGGKLPLYLALLLGMLAAVGFSALSGGGTGAVFLFPLLNLAVHAFEKFRIQADYDTVNYTVGMIAALRRLQRLRDPALDRFLSGTAKSFARLRPALRVGGVVSAGDNGFSELAIGMTLLDLISYEVLKRELGRFQPEVFAVFTALGRLDAAISIASYRQSVGCFCCPALDFAPDAPGEMETLGLVHPLLDSPVPNDFATEGPALFTGSNASGKSTFLKTAALAAVMGQGICTVTAAACGGSAFRVYTSMALRDDLRSGESYYMTEVRALKRILDAAGEAGPLLCVVDEVLRGTNTVERIAAASQVLAALAETGALVLAATHDTELCDLLGGTFRLFHFEERLGDEGMLFDYRLRPGKANTRNAIALLCSMGFPEELAARAHRQADRWLATGIWTMEY